MPAQVLFVSKPIIEPFNDGSKCLVRDVASALQRYSARIMVPRGAKVPLDEACVARVYSHRGGYRPALADNLQVLAWLLTRARERLWHFVFAPNVRTSQVGRLIKRVRRASVVQTIASPPRDFSNPARLLFGDVAVAQSEWTRQQFREAFSAAGLPVPPIEVIAPTVPSLDLPSDARKHAMRARLGINEGAPILLYPGDLEVSRGAEWVAQAVSPLLRKVPSACIVFAYRNKSPFAQARAETLQKQLPTENVRFIAEVPDMHALVAAACCVVFPVDDLYGKVDIPIVLLEAMHLATPVVALESGPLADLEGVLRVSPGNVQSMVEQATRVMVDVPFRRACVDAQLSAIERRHRPAHAAKRYEAIYDALLGSSPNSESGHGQGKRI
jgi:phosphatidylinositol alpha-1,6-mannosyltransferase